MVSLPDGEKISKISLFILAQLRNVTDRHTYGRTPGDSIYRAYAYASRGNKSNQIKSLDFRQHKLEKNTHKKRNSVVEMKLAITC